MRQGKKTGRTSIGLNAGRNLSCANVVKEGDILTKDGAEITFTKALRADFTRVDPDDHVDISADEHADAWGEESWNEEE